MTRLRQSLVLLAAALLVASSVGQSARADEPLGWGMSNGRPEWSIMRSGRLYDQQGRYAGRGVIAGDNLQIFDRQGRGISRTETFGTRGREFQARSFDQRGNTLGRISRFGGIDRFYDESGAIAGRRVTSGNVTRFYDAQGRYTGRATTTAGATRYYDETGRLIGIQR